MPLVQTDAGTIIGYHLKTQNAIDSGVFTEDLSARTFSYNEYLDRSRVFNMRVLNDYYGVNSMDMYITTQTLRCDCIITTKTNLQG